METLDDKRDDSLLVASCQDNNEEAFGILYSRHFDSIKTTLIGKTGVSEHDACDIVQKSFIKAMRNIKSFKNQSSFKTWIYRIAYNTFLDSLRSEKNNISLELITDRELRSSQLTEYSTGESPSSMIQFSELSDRVKAAREKLNDNQKKIFDIVFVAGKPYKEASEEMEIPIGTVMSRVYYTRKKLEKILQ